MMDKQTIKFLNGGGFSLGTDSDPEWRDVITSVAHAAEKTRNGKDINNKKQRIKREEKTNRFRKGGENSKGSKETRQNNASQQAKGLPNPGHNLEKVAKLCKFRGNCHYGAQCRFFHSEEELEAYNISKQPEPQKVEENKQENNKIKEELVEEEEAKVCYQLGQQFYILVKSKIFCH